VAAAHLGRDLADDAGLRGRVVADLEHGHGVGAHRGGQPGQRRGVVGQGVDRLAHVLPGGLDAETEDLGDEVLPAVEVVVEAAGLHAGQLRDVAQTRVGVALLAEDLRRGVEDALPGPLRFRRPLIHVGSILPSGRRGPPDPVPSTLLWTPQRQKWRPDGHRTVTGDG
jgi:hypothetical protein